MTTSQERFLSEILDSETIPIGRLVYLRERLRDHLYNIVIEEFLRQKKAKTINNKKLARKIGRRPDQVSRWLSAPSNWTLDTISDLLAGMGSELKLPEQGRESQFVAALSDRLKVAKPTERGLTQQVGVRRSLTGRTFPGREISRRQAPLGDA